MSQLLRCVKVKTHNLALNCATDEVTSQTVDRGTKPVNFGRRFKKLIYHVLIP